MARRRITASITKGLQKELRRVEEALDSRIGRAIGGAVVKEVRNLTSKGINPVGRGGRFPAYKGVAGINQVKKITRSLTGSRRKRGRDILAKKRKNTYPFSINKKFPNKKVRPVNIRLTGHQLRNYKFKIINVKNKFRIRLGYFNKFAALKEQGHADGVNGQPVRQTVPNKTQQFSSKITQIIIRVLLRNLEKNLKKAS